MRTYIILNTITLFIIAFFQAFSQNDQFQQNSIIGRKYLDNVLNKKTYRYLMGEKLPIQDSIYCIDVFGGNEFNSLDLNKLIDFKNITVLCLHGTFKEIPKAIFNLQNLRELQFSNVNGINWNRLFIELSDIKQLKCIKIYSGDIGFHIPESIGSLSQLERLELAYLPSLYLPDSFARLNNLLYLCIIHTNIKHITENYNNVHLLYLDISNNHFNGIPQEINNFPNLETFRFLGNIYYSTDDTILCKNLNLKRINLSECGIEDFPLGLICLSNLKELELADNNICVLPNEIVEFDKLNYLDLSSFHINKKQLNNLREKMPNCKIWAPKSVKL